MNDGMTLIRESLIRHLVERRDTLTRVIKDLPTTSDEREWLSGKVAAYREILYRLTKKSKTAKAIRKEAEQCAR